MDFPESIQGLETPGSSGPGFGIATESLSSMRECITGRTEGTSTLIACPRMTGAKATSILENFLRVSPWPQEEPEPAKARCLISTDALQRLSIPPRDATLNGPISMGELEEGFWNGKLANGPSCLQ